MFLGSNITCFTFYIHLWPICWLSLVLRSDYKASVGRMIDVRSIVRDQIKSCRELTEVFSRNLTRGTKENHKKKLRENSGYHGRDWNRALLKHNQCFKVTYGHLGCHAV
jgi:hypothetical protein